MAAENRQTAEYCSVLKYLKMSHFPTLLFECRVWFIVKTVSKKMNWPEFVIIFARPGGRQVLIDWRRRGFLWRHCRSMVIPWMLLILMLLQLLLGQVRAWLVTWCRVSISWISTVGWYGSIMAAMTSSFRHQILYALGWRRRVASLMIQLKQSVSKLAEQENKQKSVNYPWSWWHRSKTVRLWASSLAIILMMIELRLVGKIRYGTSQHRLRGRQRRGRIFRWTIIGAKSWWHGIGSSLRSNQVWIVFRLEVGGACRRHCRWRWAHHWFH